MNRLSPAIPPRPTGLTSINPISIRPFPAWLRRLWPRSLFFRAWWIALFAKLALAAWLPLSSDEAYYWVWGHFPDWSYFDHPPMIGWLFAVGRAVGFLGQSSRWPCVALGHCSFLVWREMLKPYLTDREAAYWLALLALSPLIGVGSIIATPDVPLVFFWSLSILCLRRAIDRGRPLWYLGLGAALGLGFCAKYPIVVFLPTALGWLAASGEWRRIRWGWAAAAALAGLAFCFPVLFWNARHDWASFRFQLSHGLGGGGFRASWPLEYLAGQVAILFPPLAWLALRGREPREARWLRWFAWVPLAFFLASSFKARVEANWPIAAYPAALTLAFFGLRAGFASDDSRRSPLLSARSWARGWYWLSLGTWSLALLLVLSQVARPWLPFDAHKLKTSEFSKFDSLLAEVAPLPEETFASNYQMASALSYRSGRMIAKLRGMNRRDFFDFSAQSQPKSDRFVVVAEAGERLPSWLGEQGYRVESARAVENGFQVLEVARRAQDRGR